MSRTLGQLVTEVRDHVDEATQTYWTDIQLRKWINEGLRDLNRYCETLQKNATITVTTGVQDYSAPTDVIRVSRCEWQPTGQNQKYPLEYRDLNSMDNAWGISQAVTQGYPLVFTLIGFPPQLTIRLWPIPSTGGQLNLYYWRLPADLATDGTADATTVDVPEGWWDAVVQYAEYMALRKDADPRWKEAFEIYNQKRDELMDISRRWSDQAESIQYRDSYLPSWLYDPAGGF